MNVLVTGDRNWGSFVIIEDALNEIDEKHLDDGEEINLYHGAARGADMIAAEHAKELGWTVHPFLADWSKYGKAAGPIRNRELLAAASPDVVLAFHDNLPASKGTKNMVNMAVKEGVKVLLFDASGKEVQQVVPS